MDWKIGKVIIMIMKYSLQMTSTDKDFRFMATNDLMTELQKDSIKLDDDSERKVNFLVFNQSIIRKVSRSSGCC